MSQITIEDPMPDISDSDFNSFKEVCEFILLRGIWDETEGNCFFCPVTYWQKETRKRDKEGWQDDP